MKKTLKTLMLITVMTVLCVAMAVMANAASSGDFTYEVVGGEATITGYTGSGGVVTVPDELGGYPVTTIGRYAFSSFDEDMEKQLPAYNITSLILPNSIKNIEEDAFMRVNYSSLLRMFVNVNQDFKAVNDLTVYIPASVENMNVTAFWCTEAKLRTEKYTDLKINVLYGGTETQWKKFESQWADEVKDFDLIEPGAGVDVNTVIDGCKFRVEIETEIPEESEAPDSLGSLFVCIYNDKNTVKYNCTGIEHEHTWIEYDRTYYECQEGNTIEYRCTLCGETKTETVAPKAHSYGDTYPTAEELATHCGERDYWVQCQNCNHGEYLYLTGTAEHDWIREDDFSFNCLDGGYIRYYCNNCTQFKSEYAAPKVEHEWSDYPDISEFCGTREFDCYCVNCNRGMLIDVTGTAEHDWYKNDVNFTDCEEGGEIFYDCENCEEEKVVPIEPTSHTVAWYSNHDATCTEDGTKTSYCAVCDVEDFETVTDVGSALGHDYNSKWTVLTTATCTYPGISVRACKRCADIESQTTPAYGHFDNDEDGKCDECKVIIEIYAPNDPSIPADPPVYPGDPDDTHTEHTFGNWTEKDGIMYRVCSGCGHVETEEIENTPDIPEKDDCSCSCHKKGFMAFIWKILNFFYKLFKINPVCKCGIAHY